MTKNKPSPAERPPSKIFSAALILVVTGFSLSLISCSFPDTNPFPGTDNPPITVSNGWYYRFGDSPPDETGVPPWAREKAGADGWLATDELGMPTGGGHNNMWLNVRLPPYNGRDPSLFLHSVDLVFEAYLDGKRIYSFGRMDVGGQGHFEGWPWHIILLPPDFSGKTLSLRIFSDSPDIGIVGKALLGSTANHYLRILRKDLGRVSFSALFAFIAVVIAAFALRIEDRLVLISLSAFTMQAAIWLFAETEMKQLIYNAPRFWIYLDLTALYLAPVTLIFFIEGTYARKFRYVLRGLQAISLAYTAVAISLSAAGVISLALTVAPFNVLEFCALAVVLSVTGYTALQGDKEARILLTGLLLLAPFIVYDAMNTWTGWSPPISHWGLMILVASLVLILRKRLQKLQAQSIHDGLTGLANRYRFDAALDVEWRRGLRNMKPLAIIMVDIDYFKNFNDTYGHQRGDECLKLVADVLASRVRSEPDLVARFGGEEFVVMLPETTEQAAKSVAERLRAVIDVMDIPHSSSKAADHLSISLGVAALVPSASSTPNDAIEKADRALYHAKEMGRNRVCDTTDIEKDSHPAPTR